MLSYTDMIQQYASQRDALMNMPDLDEMGGFDEFGPGDDLPFDPDMMRGPFEAITPDDLKPFVGPTIWNFTTDDLGWVMRSWLLHPVEGGA